MFEILPDAATSMRRIYYGVRHDKKMAFAGMTSLVTPSYCIRISNHLYLTYIKLMSER